jgi:CubicO group peptidase (beta-lactamase class C family)
LPHLHAWTYFTGPVSIGRIVAVVILCATVTARADELVPLPPQPVGVSFPTVGWPEREPGPGVDARRLAATMDQLFTAKGRAGISETRALLVVHRGAVIAERYAQGFGPNSRMQSWSMAKTVTQALVGILVRQGRLDLHAPLPIEAWRAPGDPRGALTLDHLLHMTSGLDNADGGGGPDSFVARLLFGGGSRDVFAFATNVGLVHAPDAHWAYSTASSMIVAGIVGRTVGGGRDGMIAFLRSQLFDPLGMASAVPEFDAAGTFLGGAFVWATARDWARLGLLYLRDGVWDGTRILPAGWVDYSRTPAPAPDNQVYGAHLWLSREPAPGQFRPLPGSPPSTFSIQGNGGQVVMIVPTYDLIVVRLGELEGDHWDVVGPEIAAVAEAFASTAVARR